MRYLVFDTETTGLFDFKQPADAPGQPRLCHLGIVKASPAMEVLEVVDFFIKPDGWSINGTVAGQVNGLTDEFLNDVGVPIADALDAYVDLVGLKPVLVAFNAQYDTKVMRGELRRAGRPDLFEQTEAMCVMKPMTNICQIPHANGRGGYKWPKLSEALKHIGIEQEGAHTANADAMGALDILRWLSANGHLEAMR